MKKLKDIENKRDKLNKQYDYCRNLLESLFKNSNAKVTIKNELKVLEREIETLTWVIDDELPF